MEDNVSSALLNIWFVSTKPNGLGRIFMVNI